jgi:tungstate transport system substrate-binding protein
VVNPEHHPGVRDELANAFLDYLVSAKTQAAIRDYQIGGESLFYPLQLPSEK